MKSRHLASRVAVVSALALLILGLTAGPASAAWPYGRPVVITPAAPAYLAPTAFETVYTAPAPAIVAAPLTTVTTTRVVESEWVPTAYVPPAVVAAPVATTVVRSAVVAAPVATTYAAPAVVAPPARVKVVFPRRVYRYYGY